MRWVKYVFVAWWAALVITAFVYTAVRAEPPMDLIDTKPELEVKYTVLGLPPLIEIKVEVLREVYYIRVIDTNRCYIYYNDRKEPISVIPNKCPEDK